MRDQVPQVTPYLRIGGREWRLGRAVSALRHPNYRLWWIGQLVSLTGTWMQSTAQQWLVFRLTGSPLALGTVTFATSLPVLLFSLFAGTVVDRVDKRRLIMMLQSGLLVLALLLATLTATGMVRTWHVLILASLLGTINAFDLPARQAFVAELVDRSDLMNAIALNSSLFNGARLAGPAIAGILIAWKGEALAFALNAVSFLAVIAALAAMRLPPAPARRKDSTPLADLREGLLHLRGARSVLALVSMAAVPSIFGFPFTTLIPVVASRRLGLAADGFGLLTSSMGLGALLGALSLASLGDFRRKTDLLHIARTVFALSLAAFALSTSVVASMLALAAAGWGMITHLATTNTLVQSMTPDALRGRVMASYTWAVVGMAPVGSLLMGAIAESFDCRTALLLGSTACLASVILSLSLFPATRRPAPET